jgi:hypothetical protein
MAKTVSVLYGLVLLFSFGSATAVSHHAIEPSSSDGPKAEVGLAEGESCPAFKANDQFGHEQDNRAVAGKNGTVLLFFRSADW